MDRRARGLGLEARFLAVRALIDAGLVIEFLHEWPFSVYRRWPSMVEEKDGWWYLPDRRDVPLSFSLRAHKPAR